MRHRTGLPDIPISPRHNKLHPLRRKTHNIIVGKGDQRKYIKAGCDECGDSVATLHDDDLEMDLCAECRTPMLMDATRMENWDATDVEMDRADMAYEQGIAERMKEWES